MAGKKYTIGIIGGGVLGQAVLAFFPGAKVYDKYKSFEKLEDVLNQDLIFVCLPTPFNKGFDRSYLDDAFINISRFRQDKIVVIKSTALPGTTDYFQQKYSNLQIIFNPEFLTAKTAKNDFANPDKQLVGFTDKSRDIARAVLSILPLAPYQAIMPAKEAELVKYAVNTYYANKVVFANMIYDLCENLRLDYGQVKAAFAADKRIVDSHFDVMHGGYRGYGGQCLPKDLEALLDFGNKRAVNVALLRTIKEMNDEYNKKPTN